MFEAWLSMRAQVPKGVPGPDELISGDLEAGYYGLVPHTEFATANEVMSAASAAGPAANDLTPWVKMSYKGKIILYPQKMIAFSYTRSYLESSALLTGNKTITVKGLKYIIRCMNATVNGQFGGAQLGSEYSDLICRMCSTPTTVETGPKLGSFTIAELGIGSMQTRTNYDGNRGVAIGSASDLTYLEDVASNSGRGWRPVLEYVG